VSQEKWPGKPNVIGQLSGSNANNPARRVIDRPLGAVLLEGLSRRLPHLGGVKPSFGMGGLDDIAPTSRRLMGVLDEHYVTARAEAVFNADPRRFAAETQANTRELRELLAKGLPELDGERDAVEAVADLRDGSRVDVADGERGVGLVGPVR
jgi:hypothetical protein